MNDALLRKRVAALEVAVGRLMAEARGRLGVLQECSMMPVECSECGEDIAGGRECEAADCPNGLNSGQA